jgi:hypothetical protein
MKYVLTAVSKRASFVISRHSTENQAFEQMRKHENQWDKYNLRAKKHKREPNFIVFSEKELLEMEKEEGAWPNAVKSDYLPIEISE